MDKTIKILLVVCLVLIALLGVSVGILIEKTYEEPTVINSNNNSTNGTVTVNKNSTNQTSKIKSTDKSVNLKKYTLVDVRSDSTMGTVRCRICGSMEVHRTVYEYVNNAGDRIMIGENYCTNCGRTTKDMWQNGEWRDI